VPRVCEFYGIVIWLYYDEHPPPHFHATYGEHAASLSIDSGDVLAGELPRRAGGHVDQGRRPPAPR